MLFKISAKMSIILRGNWNCTTDFVVDRNGEEPHGQSTVVLSKMVKELEVIDIWRERNIEVRQYIWLNIVYNKLSGARLDRLHIGRLWNNRVMNASIFPNGVSDDHMVSIDFNMNRMLQPRHFNVKLLQDALFCNSLKVWENWK